MHGADGTLRGFLNTTLFAAGTGLRQIVRPEERVKSPPVKKLRMGNLNQPSPPTRMVEANQNDCARNLALRCLVKVNRNSVKAKQNDFARNLKFLKIKSAPFTSLLYGESKSKWLRANSGIYK